MNYMVGMVRSPNIALVTPQVLNNEGFEGWWNPVEKMLEQIDFSRSRRVLIAHTLPWDGAQESGPTLSFATRIGRTKNLRAISSKT